MNLPSQFLTPCPWTVHPLEGEAGLFAAAHEAWGLGAVTPDCEQWSVAGWSVSGTRHRWFWEYCSWDRNDWPSNGSPAPQRGWNSISLQCLGVIPVNARMKLPWETIAVEWMLSRLRKSANVSTLSRKISWGSIEIPRWFFSPSCH